MSTITCEITLRSVDSADPPGRSPGERHTPQRMARAARIRLARSHMEDARTVRQRDAQRHARHVAEVAAELVAAWLIEPNLREMARRFGVTFAEAKAALWAGTTAPQRFQVVRALATRRQVARDRAKALAEGRPVRFRTTAIPVTLGGNRFPSINAAAKAMGVNVNTLWKWIRAGKAADKLSAALGAARSGSQRVTGVAANGNSQRATGH